MPIFCVRNVFLKSRQRQGKPPPNTHHHSNRPSRPRPMRKRGPHPPTMAGVRGVPPAFLPQGVGPGWLEPKRLRGSRAAVGSHPVGEPPSARALLVGSFGAAAPQVVCGCWPWVFSCWPLWVQIFILLVLHVGSDTSPGTHFFSGLFAQHFGSASGLGDFILLSFGLAFRL